jgi:magnesium-transporting ATPase (P-type)
MKTAGIKVWVLTGDKVETAINIGVSAGLLDPEMEQYLIDQIDHQELKSELEEKKYEVQKTTHVKKALIIAGASLVAIDNEPFLKEAFLQISDHVDVVLACRVSPK